MLSVEQELQAQSRSHETADPQALGAAVVLHDGADPKARTPADVERPPGGIPIEPITKKMMRNEAFAALGIRENHELLAQGMIAGYAGEVRLGFYIHGAVCRRNRLSSVKRSRLRFPIRRAGRPA